MSAIDPTRLYLHVDHRGVVDSVRRRRRARHRYGLQFGCIVGLAMCTWAIGHLYVVHSFAAGVGVAVLAQIDMLLLVIGTVAVQEGRDG